MNSNNMLNDDAKASADELKISPWDKIIDFKDRKAKLIQNFYKNTITYQIEILIMSIYFTLSWAGLVSVFTLPSIHVSSAAVHLILNVGLIAWGGSLVYIAEVLYARFKTMSLAASILRKNITFRKLRRHMEHIDHQYLLKLGGKNTFNRGTSLMLVLSASIFAETKKEVMQQSGYGVIERLVQNMTLQTISVSSESLDIALGSIYSASTTIGTFNAGYYYVPLATKLKEGLLNEAFTTLILYQNILVLKCSCSGAARNSTSSLLGQLNLTFQYIKPITETQNEVKVLLSDARYSRECLLRVWDKMGTCSKTFVRIDKKRTAFRINSINYVEPSLELMPDSTAKNISLNLYNSFMKNTEFYIREELGSLLGISVPDSTLEYAITKVVANFLQQSVANFENYQERVALFSTLSGAEISWSIYARATIITMLTFLELILCSLLVVGWIRTRKHSKTLISRLVQSLTPGLHQIGTYSILKCNSCPESLDKVIHFGEDIRSVDQSCGLLRFGLEEEIVPYRPGRKYFP
jgi:hypothetical protein